MIEKIQKFREYLDYIEEHYTNVQKAWEEIQTKCSDMKFIYDDYDFNMIDQRIKNHDLSKLEPSEFQAYRKYFYPTEKEKQYVELNKVEFERSWQSHWKHNPHHWQLWAQSEECRERYWCMVEMIADWMAMGYKFGDTAKQYYEANQEEIKIPEPYRTRMYEIFEKLY